MAGINDILNAMRRGYLSKAGSVNTLRASFFSACRALDLRRGFRITFVDKAGNFGTEVKTYPSFTSACVYFLICVNLGVRLVPNINLSN